MLKVLSPPITKSRPFIGSGKNKVNLINVYVNEILKLKSLGLKSWTLYERNMFSLKFGCSY